jgi:hypothetical protein
VSREWGNPRVVCWKDKHEVYILSNMHIPLAEGDFKEDGKAVKPVIIEDYTTCMGYVDLSDTIPSSYSISKKTWK